MMTKEIRSEESAIIADCVLTARAVKGLLLCASTKGECREQLKGIKFEVRRDTMHAVATNGHILAHYSAPIAASEDCDLFVDRECTEKAIQVAGVNGSISFSARREPPSIAAYDKNQSFVARFDIARDDMVFPDWRKVVYPDTDARPSVEFGYAARYFELAGKATQLVMHDSAIPGFRVDSVNTTGPARLVAKRDCEQLDILIMPCRV